MEKTRRNKRTGTEWKIGMEIKIWKNKELMTGEGEKETAKSNTWAGPKGSRRLTLQFSRHMKVV